MLPYKALCASNISLFLDDYFVIIDYHQLLMHPPPYLERPACTAPHEEQQIQFGDLQTNSPTSGVRISSISILHTQVYLKYTCLYIGKNLSFQVAFLISLLQWIKQTKFSIPPPIVYTKYIQSSVCFSVSILLPLFFLHFPLLPWRGILSCRWGASSAFTESKRLAEKYLFITISDPLSSTPTFSIAKSYLFHVMLIPLISARKNSSASVWDGSFVRRLQFR